MLEALTKYTVFHGRAGRREYWFFVLFNVLVCFAGVVMDSILGHRFHLFETVATLALFVPGLAVSFRRLHDIDRTAWWLLIVLIPVVGWAVLLVFHLLPGTPGPNRYGSHPGLVDGWPPIAPVAA
jgi:uncharacterized membrane protein YhaH (DUF805 family)